MYLVSRLRRTLAMTTVLLGLLTGLGVASANAADAPILTGGGGRQTPRVAEQNPAILPNRATTTPLPTPSPLTPSSPLSSATPSTDIPSSPTGSTGSGESAPAKSTEETDDQDAHTVRFDPADGSKPTQASVKTGTLASPPEHNPQRQGFRFDGWMLDGQPYDFQTPVLQDTTLKARWSKTTDWTLSPDHGPASGTRLTISPPDSQESYYITIHAAGEQTVGLTGDGRIYTWSQEGTPTQVHFPAQAAEGFHYLQATAGSRRQAALGSDQRIYTWNSRQATPTILNIDQNTGFTSISTDNDRLLAVDQQGRVHAFQTSQSDTQSPIIKPIEQATADLPGQAHAVLAAASSSQDLIVDTDGQAWTWETNNTWKAKPVRIKTKFEIRIIQAQALSRGFLLLDADGQAWYLADSTTNPIAVSLPDGQKASRIAGDKDQAIITGTDGCIRAWKPGSKPVRADDGSQAYMQAVATGNRITTIDKQGRLLTWSLDAQDKPGKPSRLVNSTTPTLESASLDGQPLKLSKTGDAWQTQAPAHKPGLATITLAGKQYGQPFTKNLNYTVDQPLTRNAERSSALTVHFDAGEGSPKPADQDFSTPYGRAKRPSPDPVRDGYQFDGWFIGEDAYDFSKLVTQNLTLTAKWTFKDPNNTWKINPDKGSQTGGQQTTITPPDNHSGIRFSQFSISKDNFNSEFTLAVGSDGNAYAWGYNGSGQLGDGTVAQRTTPVQVKKPAGAPADFKYVQVSAGGQYSMALGNDGNAYAWGYNGNGQQGNGTTGFGSTTPVQVKKPAGTPANFNYVQVSAGCYYSMVLGSDGNAYAMGNNYYGELGNGTTTQRTTPVQVKKPAGAPANFNYVQISAGSSHSLALGNDGNAYAWGYNGAGQLGNGMTGFGSTTPVQVKKPAGAPANFNYVQVSAGYQYSLFITSTEYGYSLALGNDGNAYAWGYNNYGQLGNGTTTQRTTPVQVKKPAGAPANFNYVQVSAGCSYSLAVGSDGYAYAWGHDNYGQLGNNTTSDDNANPAPVHVRDPSSPADASRGLKTSQVRAGSSHSLALGSDGNAYAWGYNKYNQLGDGTTNDSKVPVPVLFTLQPVITDVRFDTSPAKNQTPASNGNSVTVLTPEHAPGQVKVSINYTMSGNSLTYDSLTYTYTPVGVLPKAGGEGILLALATGTVGMGGVLASRRHRKETH